METGKDNWLLAMKYECQLEYISWLAAAAKKMVSFDQLHSVNFTSHFTEQTKFIQLCKSKTPCILYLGVFFNDHFFYYHLFQYSKHSDDRFKYLRLNIFSFDLT